MKGFRVLIVVGCLAPQVWASPDGESSEDGISETDISDEGLRPFDEEPYKTPRAGEGFRTNVFGRDVRVPARNRRSVSAWDLGLAVSAPGADETELLPFGSLYFWRRPDDDTIFRAIVVGVFNEVLYAKSPESFGPFEWIVTFENFTVPTDLGENIDGTRIDEEELLWGYIRPGVGFGYRQPIEAGAQDNMFAVDFTVEPSFYYFDDGSDTAPSFAIPQDTFENRLHLQLRYDALERNLLELPHAGYAAGGDLIYGHRANWEDWGDPALSGAFDGADGSDFLLFTGYALASTDVPFLDSETNRFVATVHGGVGSDVDRFSAQRLGGGPHPRGEEFGSVSRPVLPGATIGEFFPEHYVVAVAEYRRELMFFTHLTFLSSIGYLDRDRRHGGLITREDDILASVGARLTSGFIGDLRVQLDYNYSFGVIRQGEFGGHEVVFHFSRQF